MISYDPPPSPGKITATELLVGPFSDIFHADFTGSAAATMPLVASLGNFNSSGMLRISWPDVKQASTYTVDTSEIEAMFRFNTITPAIVLDGIKEVPNLLRTIAGNSGLSRNLPVIGTNAQSLIILADQFDALLATLEQYDTAQKFQQTLQTKLNTLLPGSDVQVMVATDVRFVLHLHQVISNPALGFNVNTQLQGSGIGFQLAAQTAVTGAVDATLGLGVSFDSNLSAADRFYVITGTPIAPVSTATLNLAVNANATIQASATLGSLQVGINNGSLSLTSSGSLVPPPTPVPQASLGIALRDPTAVPDGKLTLKEIQDLTAQSNLASILESPSLNGKLHVDLPIAWPAGLPQPNCGPDPLKIVADWTWQNINDLSTPPQIGQPTSETVQCYANALTQFDINTVLAGLQYLLTMFQKLASNQVLNTPLPLINKTPAELAPFVQKAITLIQKIQSDTPASSTSTGFDTYLLNQAVQRAGVGDVISITAGNTNAPAMGSLNYVLHFQYSASETYPFNLGLGNNLLTLQTPITPSATIAGEIEFGLNPQQGFYLVDQQGTMPEIRVHAGIDAPAIHAGGKIGPLQLTYGVDGGTANLGADFTVNLVSLPGSGGIIPISLVGSNLQDVVKPAATGAATVNLPFGLRIGDDGPGVIANFSAYWNANNPSRLCFGTPGSFNCPSDPKAGFSHVKFELGEWLGKVAGPVLQNIKTYNPLPRELVDVMQRPLPVLNVTPLDVLFNVGNLPKEIKLVFAIAQVVDQFSSQVGGDAALELDLSAFLGGSPPPPQNRSTGSEQGGIGGTNGKDSIWKNLR
ncbi:MAG: hypothetical protein SGJ20_11000, partial [Planctomycetota bacterium]|nr:hypothetical protein [Planctomycetota bacterium]